MGFSLGFWVIVEIGHSSTANSLPSLSMGELPQGWVFLKLILPSTVPTWEPGIPGSGCRSSGRLRHDSLLQIESLGKLRHVDLPRIGSLGRSKRVNLLGPLDWQIPEQVEVWQSPEDQILGRWKQNSHKPYPLIALRECKSLISSPSPP